VNLNNTLVPVGCGFTPAEVTERLEQMQTIGAIDHPDLPRVAVIGARACSPYGEHIATELAADIAAHDLCVVSTFSYGIDNAALRAALTAGGRVIGAATQALDLIHPTGTATVQERARADGQVFTVHPDAKTPSGSQLQMTYAVIAHLADAIVIIEADLRSATFAAANEAHRIGRPVYAVPGPITSAVSRGTHAMLRNGTAQILTHYDDLELSK
jgi:DNA processing protein